MYLTRLLVAPRGVFLQAALDHRLDRHRDALWPRPGRIPEDRREQLRNRRSVEGLGARHHLVEQDTERPDVRARIGDLAAHLLRRHRVRRPRRGARRHQRHHRRRADEDRLVSPSQPEIDNLQPPVPGDHRVGRLEVAMHDLVLVRVRQRVSRLQTIADGLVQPQRAALVEALAQGAALDMLHRDERRAIGVTDFVDRADVRMVQGGSVAGLAQQSAARRVNIARGVNDLERHRPVERRVIREEHGAHAPAAEQALDPIAPQSRARRRA